MRETISAPSLLVGERLFGFQRGFTLVEMLIVVAIIAILSAIVVPQVRVHQNVTRKATCLANLKLLNVASHAYVLRVNLSDTAEIKMSDLVSPEGISDRSSYFILQEPICPSGGEYSYDKAAHAWKCSLGGGKDANNGFPHSEVESTE